MARLGVYTRIHYGPAGYQNNEHKRLGTGNVADILVPELVRVIAPLLDLGRFRIAAVTLELEPKDGQEN